MFEVSDIVDVFTPHVQPLLQSGRALIFDVAYDLWGVYYTLYYAIQDYADPIVTGC